MSKLSIMYIENKTKYTMQFLADIIKKMSDNKIINKEDLYSLSEKKIIEKIEDCEYKNISKCFEIWRNSTYINESDILVKNKYCINIEKVKIRYINPLVKLEKQYKRISDISDVAKENIEKTLNFKTKKYAYLDFNF